MRLVQELFVTLQFGLAAIGTLLSGVLLGAAVLLSYVSVASASSTAFALAVLCALWVGWANGPITRSMRRWILLASTILQCWVGIKFILTPGMEWPGVYLLGPLSLLFSFIHFVRWRARRAAVKPRLA